MPKAWSSKDERQYNLESNLFRNPGEAVEEETGDEKKPMASADAAVGAGAGRMPLLPV